MKNVKVDWVSSAEHRISKEIGFQLEISQTTTSIEVEIQLGELTDIH